MDKNYLITYNLIMDNIKHEIIKPAQDMDIVITLINMEAFRTLGIPIPVNGIAPHWHRSIEFSYVRKGSVDLWINNKKKHLIQGDFIFVNSCQVHRLNTNNIQDCEIVLTIIPYNILQRFIPDIDNLYFDIYQGSEYDPIFSKAFHFFYQHLVEPSPFDRLKINSYIFDLLYTLVNKYQVKYDMPSTEREFQHQILSFIEQNYTYDLTLCDLSQKFHLNPEYLSRKFKQMFGVNFKTYLTEYRLDAAMEDIINSELNMQDIALNHGFSSTKSLIFFFKKYYHQTPYQYRLKHKLIK